MNKQSLNSNSPIKLRKDGTPPASDNMSQISDNNNNDIQKEKSLMDLSATNG